MTEAADHARSRRQPVRSGAAGALCRRHQDRAERAPTFAEMFDTRFGALSPDARRFLETLAICGRPMAPEIVCAACGIARERQSLVAMLRSSHLIRSSGSSERVETYHDRIREVLAAQIAPDAVRRIHRRMVQALVERGSDDCEALFEHYRGAGDAENASIQAGLCRRRRPASALAFDRAAWFYRQALALRPASPAAAAWQEGLAGALANAGRPAEAAEAYLRAAAGAVHLIGSSSSGAPPSSSSSPETSIAGWTSFARCSPAWACACLAAPGRRCVVVVAACAAALARLALRAQARR